jgi:hypothetical protein
VGEGEVVPTVVSGEISSVADERKTFGQINYEASVRTRPPPWKAWIALTDAQRGAWEAGAAAVVRDLMAMVERVAREEVPKLQAVAAAHGARPGPA